MQSKASTIAAYLAGLGDKERAVMETLSRLVRDVVPDAVGTMKYGMPTYELAGRMLAFNVQRNYFSLYADPEIVKRHRADLGALDIGKSCIRFRKIEDLPLGVLRKLVADYVR
ncbi:MAG TPA: DUF1801 domain-containing protein [Opitutaceae bacterium]